MTHAQRERLAFIDFSLEFFGQIARAELIEKFGTGLASCTRDLALYREIAPTNAILMHENKRYFRSDSFKPIFNHDPDSAFRALEKGFGDGFSMPQENSQLCFSVMPSVFAKSEIISAITRSIYSNTAVKCQYESLNSGTTTREIVPHAVVNNGRSWHVRAYDRKSSEFKDFVCTRLNRVELITKEVKNHEQAEKDLAWNMFCELQIVPHPKLIHSKAIEMDYGMINGVLKFEVRAAMATYLLRLWNVDCSEIATSSSKEHQLHLKNKNDLVGLINF